MKFELVDDASLIWQRWSVKIVAAQGVIASVYAGLHLAGLAPELPDWLLLVGFVLFSAAALTATQFKQTPKDGQ